MKNFKKAFSTVSIQSIFSAAVILRALFKFFFIISTVALSGCFAVSDNVVKFDNGLLNKEELLSFSGSYVSIGEGDVVISLGISDQVRAWMPASDSVQSLENSSIQPAQGLNAIRFTITAGDREGLEQSVGAAILSRIPDTQYILATVPLSSIMTTNYHTGKLERLHIRSNERDHNVFFTLKKTPEGLTIGTFLKQNARENRPEAAVDILARIHQRPYEAFELEDKTLENSIQVTEILTEGAAAQKRKGLIAAAKSGDGTAQYKLFQIYRDGTGINKDDNAAFYWLVTAAKAGHVEAVRETARQFSLGRDQGALIDKQLSRAYFWYKRLAELGDPHGYYWMAILTLGGHAGPPDQGKALNFFKLGAERGDYRSQHRLGRMYMYGDGVPRDPAMALAWFEKAHANGHERSHHFIAAIKVKQRPTNERPTSRPGITAKETGVVIGTILKGLWETSKAPPQPELAPTARNEPNCFEVLEREYFVCDNVPDSYACSTYGCNYNWECHRESRVPIGGGKVRIVKGKSDSRFGQCRRPNRDGYKRYCDPRTGIESDDFRKLANKACR